MEWTTQQAGALRAVSAWLKDRRGPQVFRLFGYAGTGKTTIAKHLAQGVDGMVCFACFTGKAALVMASKGCTGATTIHSLIYKVEEGDDGDPIFIRNMDSMAAFASLIVVDECSQVDDDLGRDLLSYGTKILVLGDPEQLKPVKGEGFFTSAEPDIMLTEIRRQEADNPIIHLSMEAREGRRLKPGHYGDSKVITRAAVDRAEVLAADQILVGLNKTRMGFNARIRQLRGFCDPMPQPGDRLVCLRNNREKGLLNGSLWEARETKSGVLSVHMDVHSLDGLADPGTVKTPREFFLGTEKDLPWERLKGVDQFTYGYALTVHKAQGSQWDHVMLFDESATFRDQRKNHLYTGITRAAERLTVVV